MNSKPDGFQLILVSPSKWEGFVSGAFSSLELPEQSKAEAILTALHDQHIGITPVLIASWLRTLRSQTPPEEPWLAVGNCLARALIPVTKPRQELVQGIRLQLFNALDRAPLYTVLRLLTPLLASACRQIGYSYLFCHHNDIEFVQAKTYEAYHEKLVGIIKEMARERDDGVSPFDLFWRDMAHMLNDRDSQTHGLAQAEPLAAALLYRLEQLPERPEDQTLRRLHTLVTPIRTRHRQEGGVRGIRVSRRLEDIHDILLSEFMNPEPLLIDRLLNTGYLIFEREPKREKLRDLLLMGIMPDITRRQCDEQLQQSQLSADFAKVSWFNFAAHLGLLLRHYQLWQSEFRWIEGDPWQRSRVDSRILRDLQREKMRVSDIVLDRAGESRQRRHHFLRRMNWLPDFLNMRGRYEPLTGWNDVPIEDSRIALAQESETETEPKKILRELVDWVRATQAQQKDNPHWKEAQRAALRQRPAAQSQNRKLAVDDFTFVHIMLFLPATYRHEWGGDARARLNVAAQLGRNDPRRNLSVVWVPTTIVPPVEYDSDGKPLTRSDVWSFHAPRYPDGALLRRRLNDPAEIADTLVQAWLDELMREIEYA